MGTGRPANPKSIAYRDFIRDYMLTDRAKARVRRAILTDNRVLTKAMDITVGRLDEESGGGTTNNVNILILEGLSRLPPEAVRRYAETGELDPSLWSADVLPAERAA